MKLGNKSKKSEKLVVGRFVRSNDLIQGMWFWIYIWTVWECRLDYWEPIEFWIIGRNHSWLGLEKSCWELMINDSKYCKCERTRDDPPDPLDVGAW